MKRTPIAANACHLVLAFVLFLTSCVKEIDEYNPSSNSAGTITDINQLQAPPGFNYSLEKRVSLQVSLKTNTNAPLANVKIQVLTGMPANKGRVVYSGCTNTSGLVNTNLTIPRTTNSLIIRTAFPGIPDYTVLNVNTGTIQVTLGGSNPQPLRISANAASNPSGWRSATLPALRFMGTWDAEGVPDYLTTTRDQMDASFLNRINASLPESEPVPVRHPGYLAGTVAKNIAISQTTDVWMTFVHEGSVFKNTIGYYKYHKNNPPSGASQINVINVVFPNVSYINSGGGLVSGDKVYLGTFGPDTMIGFVLLPNGYNPAVGTVSGAGSPFYSNEVLNPENDPGQRIHTVQFWDQNEQKMVIGFEDTNRNSGSDDDFNDVIIAITANPAASIQVPATLRTATPVDTDGDGVNDDDDDYPTDPDLAFNNYYPGDSIFGYLAYEDLWPYRGDYDMNDLLVGYRFNTITNSSNDVKEIQSKIFVKAAGGSYQHGFGIALPVPGYFVESVNGPIYSENYITNTPNGTEAGQNEAVIVVFDNSNTVAPRPSGFYVNTEPGSPIINSDTIRLAIRFVAGIPPVTVGNPPYNPFLISNKRRGYEIHLPDKPPTTLADPALFNTGQDRSNPSLGVYYKTDRNLPWSINVPGPFQIITEKTPINNAYLHFTTWAESGGTLYPDWYEDKPGYRDLNKILNR